MVRKRLDDRIRFLLERGVATNQRSMLVLVGDESKNQVPNLHQILSKIALKRLSVLWCYKKELGFSTHRLKRLKKLKRDKARGLLNNNNNVTDESNAADTFELFISNSQITWCYYKDSHRVLGTTHDILILQDFEAITPNLLARTMETVAGGGLIILLFRTVKSLQQLYAISMDVHNRYRTESAGDVVPRFNERFILSLAQNPNALVCDDELNVLPISRRALRNLRDAYEKGDAGEVIVKIDPHKTELKELQESLLDTPHVGVLVELTKTLDQAKAVLTFLEACADEKQHQSSGSAMMTTIAKTVAMTAARGRGKSAALGLCLAGAISLGYSNLVVTAPEPENLVSVFEFLLRGLKALKYQEHLDFEIQYNSATGREATKCVTAIHLFRTHKQTIRYVAPQQLLQIAHSTAEIVAIDEAAAIPLPTVKAIMKASTDRLTFLSSTVNGYEGTGRSLSLKLIKELREAKGGRNVELEVAQTAAQSVEKTSKKDKISHEQRYAAAAAAIHDGDRISGSLREIELATPIRYAPGDEMEDWLNHLLCLDSGNAANLKLNGGAPAPGDCELYSVDRDALFSFHKLSEAFLQKVMGLYTSAHYKNTPNDLQMLSDAPSHSLFVLLSPHAENEANNRDTLPDVLAVVQVALEGKISRKAVEAQLARGHRSAGDLIPWTISQQFGDSKFAQLSGARIVRIAVHPAVQGMGYGTRAMELLYRFYNGEMISLVHDDDGLDDENDEEKEESDHGSDSENEDATAEGLRGEHVKPKKELPPLLLPLTEVDAPRLDWIGTSFGLTLELQKFWSRCGMKMLYLRQTKNELTGEQSSIMVRSLPKPSGVDDAWLPAFVSDTRRRFISLLGGVFRDINVRLALSVLDELHSSEYSNDKLETKSDRSGASTGKITVEELDYFLTSHDLKRLELYGRNLCDHHLVTDLLPVIARLYFLERFGKDVSLSNVQAALLCGIGLQSRSVDELTLQLGLPSNQVLAMFNKTVRKISLALDAVVEDKEKQALLGGEKRKKAERAVEKMKDVARQTLEEDVNDAAENAIDIMKEKFNPTLPDEIARDAELMQYVVKGSSEQWEEALKDRETYEDGPGTIRIQASREKRKAIDDTLERGAISGHPSGKGKKKTPKAPKKKKTRS
jgi:N-acetyltransferase 10